MRVVKETRVCVALRWYGKITNSCVNYTFSSQLRGICHTLSAILVFEFEFARTLVWLQHNQIFVCRFALNADDGARSWAPEGIRRDVRTSRRGFSSVQLVYPTGRWDTIHSELKTDSYQDKHNRGKKCRQCVSPLAEMFWPSGTPAWWWWVRNDLI